VILGVFRQEPTMEETPMALDDSAPSELLEMFRTGDGLDSIRESVRVDRQELMCASRASSRHYWNRDGGSTRPSTR
jgi:hypothetical protein